MIGQELGKKGSEGALEVQNVYEGATQREGLSHRLRVKASTPAQKPSQLFCSYTGRWAIHYFERFVVK